MNKQPTVSTDAGLDTSPVVPTSQAPGNAARDFWSAYEPIHALCYFHSGFADAMAETGLTGFWNGYFAGRAAPLGACTAPVVTALFFGFSAEMVDRAVPKVWGRVHPEDALLARFEGARRVLPEFARLGAESDVVRVVSRLEHSIESTNFDGRALAAAWVHASPPEALAPRLWWATTVLREHRGDGHVIAAAERGLTGLKTTITHAAAGLISRPLIQAKRGWSDEEWMRAVDELIDEGILSDPETLSSRGYALRVEIENATDRLCRRSLEKVRDADWVIRVLGAISQSIFDSGVLPVPNPIGVSRRSS